jgi:hypothetical protein
MYGEAELPQAVAEAGGGQGHLVHVQLVLYTYRITGQVVTAGVPQRLTDFLNNFDGNLLVLQHGRVEDILAGTPPQPLEVAQVRLDTVLFVAPRGGLPDMGDPFERVVKTPLPVTVLLPGYTLTGKVFILPDAQLANAPIGGRRFAPLVDATITPSGDRERAWQEPMVAFSTPQAAVYSSADA